MNENANSPVKWLQYLLYLGIAMAANMVLSLFLPGNLTRWLSYAGNAALTYLMFRLARSNPRYKTSGIFYAVSLVITVLGIPMLGLGSDICAIVAQYQEYHAHGNLIKEQDPKLAGKWGGLFWLQVGFAVIATLLGAVIATALIMAEILEEAAATTAVTIIVPILSLVLRALYLSYLNRTIKLLGNEIVVE